MTTPATADPARTPPTPREAVTSMPSPTVIAVMREPASTSTKATPAKPPTASSDSWTGVPPPTPSPPTATSSPSNTSCAPPTPTRA